jgi:alpha-beta hydrolase superfamily lysophospholipase
MEFAMQQPHTFMRENNFQKAKDLWRLPTDHRNLYTSRPHPAANYAEAVQRVESKIATEVNFYPDSHTILMTHGARTAKTIVFVHGYPSSPGPFKEIVAQFFNRGYNVLAMTMPYHGLADRMNTEHEKLRAEDFVRYADNVVDIARGLGDHVTMVGISCGGLVTAWAAQQRQDIDLAVLISPGFGFKAIPRFWTPLAAWAFRVLPNSYLWDDPHKKAESPNPYNYLRLSTHALGQILRLSRSIQVLTQRQAPAADSILVITNLNDPAVDNSVTDEVVNRWRTRWAKEVKTYQFPADLGLGHDIISVDEPNMKVAVVYPKLFELIDP